MSQAKLTLRPPPNVDFVQGYPGIPPGAERPQAAVKGAIEVRVNQQGVKAKWVRIELRKVEVLPGGGQAGTFFDYVGQSPVNLWTATEGDYGILRPQDFPFYIRVPESLPPTIALEKGAGIKYELIAMVCIKGKKGFFRRSKSSVLSTASQIVIDKHELHSTWPVYSQPETRNLAQDGVSLSVERGQTCYGPGDRISVAATLKSDSLHTVILRGFEFTLKETTVFRSGPHTTGKKGAPQVKVTIIAEQKVPVNKTLYGGTQFKADLACTVPSYHTSATITAARHIDITYVLNVKALMGTGLPVAIDLPVIVSNWPRNVSVEAARRIGTAPNLSIVIPNAGVAPTVGVANGAVPTSTYVTRPGTADRDRVDSFATGASGSQFNTAPSSSANGYGYKTPADEMGFAKPSYNTVSGQQSTPAPPSVSGQSSSYFPERSGSASGRPGSAGQGASGSSSGIPARTNVNSRFNVTNFADDIPEESPTSAIRANQMIPPPVAAPAPVTAQKAWISAEEEKRQLYERAKAQVDRVQGGGVSSSPQQSSPPQSAGQSQGHIDAGPILQGPGSQPTPWSTAEAEKERLYEQAQAAAMRTQGLAASYSPPNTGGSSGIPPPVSVGAALYQQAMSAVNREAANVPARAQNSSPIQNPVGRAPVPQYPSVESEKTALKRYYEAKAAASRSQGQDYASAEPISYDALYPVNNSGSSQPTPPPPSSPPPPMSNGNADLPPAFSSGTQHPILSEKERMRRHYEAQEAAAAPPPAHSSPPPAMTPPAATPPPLSAPPPPAVAPYMMTNGVAEKELLRRKYEAEDAAAARGPGGRAPPPTPPPRSFSQHSAHGLPQVPRSPPILPATPIRQLTAAEEKARLKAQYEADDARTSPAASGIVRPGSAHSNYSNGALPTPPPLRPRPPVHYIRETQEEDTRTQSQLYTLDQGDIVPEFGSFPTRQASNGSAFSKP